MVNKIAENHMVKVSEKATSEMNLDISKDVEHLKSTIDTLTAELTDLRTKNLMLRKENTDNRSKANEALNNLAISEFQNKSE